MNSKSTSPLFLLRRPTLHHTSTTSTPFFNFSDLRPPLKKGLGGGGTGGGGGQSEICIFDKFLQWLRYNFSGVFDVSFHNAFCNFPEFTISCVYYATLRADIKVYNFSVM